MWQACIASAAVLLLPSATLIYNGIKLAEQELAAPGFFHSGVEN